MGNKASLALHLFEFKRRLVMVLFAFLALSGIGYMFCDFVMHALLQPLSAAFASAGVERKIIYTDLTEAFVTKVKLALFVGLLGAMPIALQQLYAFAAPGLFKRERKVMIMYMISAPILFIMGGALVYKYIMPLAWQFFLSFESEFSSGNLPLVLEAKIGEYLSLTTSLIIAFGLAFQLPLALALLAQLGLADADSLRKYRRHAIVVIFLVAAILTPPDVLSQIALAIPLMILYETSIILVANINKQRNVKHHA